MRPKTKLWPHYTALKNAVLVPSGRERERSLRVLPWSQVKEVYCKINILQYSILAAI